jgi:hypothetical protein
MKRIDTLLLGVVLSVIGVVFAIQYNSDWYLNSFLTSFQALPLEGFQYLMYFTGLLSGGLWAYYRFVQKKR